MKWNSTVALGQKAVRTSLILAGISLLLLFLPYGARQSVSTAIRTLFYSHFEKISDKLDFLVNVYEINQQLKRDNAKQNLELAALREYEKENARLRELLGFRDRSGYELIAAEMVAVDPKRRENAVISKVISGAAVSSNLPVVNVDGLVGKTTSVLGDQVTVELLTSPNCRAAARDASTRVLGIIRWAGGRTLLLDNVSLSDSVHAGDTIITSGLGGTFPDNLPIGTVSSVEIGRSPFFKHITVEPFVDFGALDELMILKLSE